MALICPVCSAENREGANFCRSCGGKLAPAAPAPMAPPPGPESRSEREWAATAPAQLRAPTIPGGLFDGSLPIASQAAYAHAGSLADEKTVIVGAGRSKRPPSPPREPRVKKASRPRTPRPVGAEVRKPPRVRGILLWLVLLAVGLLMIVAGWYGYGKGTPAEQAEAASTAAPVAAPAVAPAPASPASEAAPLALPPIEPPAAADAALAAAAPATPTIATPKPPSAAKSRKPAPAAPSQPSAPEAAPAVAAAPAPQPAAAGPTDPQSICGDRNFIAKAQCMAAQCLKPEFKPHAQCEAVRRQQRIEEEKRNPTLVN
ncbi:zinc ribbon domain-containing protein [Variovorax sp. DXTD-1]|uniref:zinc ribbon domain-containing protein n=1 Tax=Variovorax sp. DXTD-1 TaxID=2495592 RepID=UPI000F8714DA|nr:zinc ribbon domain-containing protein [Variovorax sp. DXTD-1]RST46961.1 zinc ribbon domain-containing protein [Variovorax sp. DXTD-1]